ncbi:hypothetical protein NLU13_2785 [Sarocladium strictum]|uniref:DUF4484 domain-containing protein n=1 Tax=Sarocladium strictum TaxID=5046 RepID=A0AA39L9T2_SARSR|nr:hypothetical protein NLU13_2785 [Sarocladium strictum]
MASSRRDPPQLTIPTSSSMTSLPDLPSISALFLIDFDVKAGYTIVWKQAVDDVELDGRVEYKSLPSGLHTVSEDLIYFVHEGTHAGLSAFVNVPCEEEEARNARMIAVGVLVPLSYGRLGRAWRHAEGLKAMAVTLAESRKDTSLLEKYWEANKPQPNKRPGHLVTDEAPVSSAGIAFPSLTNLKRREHTRDRSASDGAALVAPEHKLSPYHPAWSLTSLLDQFGPLIFPIHRAALLRQRILISCHAPVHEICDFVYNISVLSNIPLSVMDFLPSSSPTQRLRPLFTIGVHDIPFLMEDFEAFKRRGDPDEATEEEAGTGWIACTTDSILAMKDTLWDMLITIPPDYAANAQEKVWPVVECPRGKPIKATQRDLRRYNALRSGLHRLVATNPAPESPSSTRHDLGGRPSTSSSNRPRVASGAYDAMDKIAEPPSWAALAYNGFMWWASAGEQLRSEEHEESQRDAALLADLGPSPNASMSMPPPSTLSDPLSSSLSSLTARRPAGDGAALVELAIIAYFHRLTTQMFSVIADVVEAADEGYADDIEEEEATEGAQAEHTSNGHEESNPDSQPLLPIGVDSDDDLAAVTVDSRSMENMGLDVWSGADALFVNELMKLYFGREARIEGKGVEVCGVRVC